jgi:hypothetical protein
MLPVAANAPRTITIGGFTFDWDPIGNANDVLLIAVMSGTSTRYSTARKLNSVAGLVVPGGRSLTVVAAKTISFNSPATYWGMGQSDNDVGIQSSTSPTNPVYASNVAIPPISAVAGGVGATSEVGGILFSVPATKYLTLIGGGVASDGVAVYLFCKLV